MFLDVRLEAYERISRLEDEMTDVKEMMRW